MQAFSDTVFSRVDVLSKMHIAQLLLVQFRCAPHFTYHHAPCRNRIQEIVPLGPPVPESLLPASAPMPAPFAGGRAQ